jgi:hypothetical protein
MKSSFDRTYDAGFDSGYDSGFGIGIVLMMVFLLLVFGPLFLFLDIHPEVTKGNCKITYTLDRSWGEVQDVTTTKFCKE